jgi:transposase, IS30 family
MKKHTGRKPFSHLTQYERDRIEHMRRNGIKRGAIAAILGRNKGTISRELNKYTNKHHRYRATPAQERAEARRKGSKQVGMKIEKHQRLKRRIIRELEALRSPDEIAGRMKEERCVPRVGTNAIYKWLYGAHGKAYCRYLCSRKVRKLSQSRLAKRRLIPNRISLALRPNDKKQVHGESDLFVSPTTLHSPVVGHLAVVPDAMLLAGQLIKNKSSRVMVDSMRLIQKELPVTTWTLDNGIENISHEQFGVPAYFCMPGSPWQKPHVENSIGLVRRWFLPKGTDLATVPQETFQSMLFVFNHKYRKSLGYKSAYEVSLARGIIKKIPQLSKDLAVAFR